MGWLDGFSFKTKEQREKESKAFEKQVFPLGIWQRDAARAVLEQFEMPKISSEQRLFAFICAKEKHTEKEDAREALQSAADELNRHRWLPPNARTVITALLLLEAGAEDLERYPTAEQVRQKAQELAERTP